jgi:hypothetical protein
MARETVYYFETDDGQHGRVARDRETRGSWVDGEYEIETVHDYLVIEHYEDGEWRTARHLGSYCDPGNLSIPKP